MSKPVSIADPFGRDTSGSTLFRMTTADIIAEAYAICQIGIDGEDLNAEMYENGRRSLNLLLSGWQAQGLHLWTYQEGTLFPVKGKSRYTLEQCRATNNYTATKTTSAAVSGANTLNLETVELLLDQEVVEEIGEGWSVGVMLSDCSLQWLTVDTKTGNDVTFTNSLSEDIPEGAGVVFYKEPIKSVERVLNLRRLDSAFYRIPNEQPISMVSHQEYYNLPNKQSTGSPSLGYYQRGLPEGTLHIWPSAPSSTVFINFTYERKIDDFVENDDCSDLPKYWLTAVCYGLANRLKTKYRVPAQVSQEINEQYRDAMATAMQFDNELGDISVSIDRSV